MRILRFCVITLLTLLTAVSCSPGGDESITGAGHEDVQVALTPDIDGFMGMLWGDGTDMLSGDSSFMVEKLGDKTTFIYNGVPRQVGDLGIEADSETYVFNNGGFTGGVVSGANMADMEAMRDYYLDEFGAPQEQSDGHYRWESRTGYAVIEGMGDGWRMVSRAK